MKRKLKKQKLAMKLINLFGLRWGKPRKKDLEFFFVTSAIKQKELKYGNAVRGLELNEK